MYNEIQKSLPSSNFNHDVSSKYVGRKEHPKHVVQQQARKQQGGHLQRG